MYPSKNPPTRGPIPGGQNGQSPGLGVGVTSITTPNGPPGNARRGTASAVIAAVDNASTPKYATVLVNNKLPGESGYLMPIGAGPFAAGGTAGFAYHYNNSSGVGGSWVNVDLDRRVILSFTGAVSTSAPTPFYKAISDHLHNGNFNADGYTNPIPVNLTGETQNVLPYNQNTLPIQGVISSTGKILSVEFPGAWIDSDGSIANVDGLSTLAQYYLPVGYSLSISSDVLDGRPGIANPAIILGTSINGYGIIWYGSGSIALIKYVNAVGTNLTTPVSATTDNNYHAYRLTVTSGSPNMIQGTIDSTVLFATDSSLNLSLGGWPITVYTG